MNRLYRVSNGGRSPQDIEFCYVLAADAIEAAMLGKAFLRRLDLLPDPGLMPKEPKAWLTDMPPLEQQMRALGRVCTMNETGRKIPVIPEDFPPADKAVDLTPEQMRDLMDKHGYTTREIAEMYDDLPWQRVSGRVAKLRNSEGKIKDPAPEKPEKPTLLKPSSYQGEMLQYQVSEKDIKFFSTDEE